MNKGSGVGVIIVAAGSGENLGQGKLREAEESHTAQSLCSGGVYPRLNKVKVVNE